MNRVISSDALPRPAGTTAAAAPRLLWLDLAKALGMLLVIAGHSLPNDPERGYFSITLIFAFHMPLFFIIAGVTFRPSATMHDFIRRRLKSCRRLLLPALLGVFLLHCLNSYRNGLQLLPPFSFSVWLNTYIMMPCYKLAHFPWPHVNVLGFWFFPVLFMALLILDLTAMAQRGASLWLPCLILSLMGVLCAPALPLPLNADIALTVLPFLLCGLALSRLRLFTKDVSPFTLLLLSVPALALCALLTWPFVLPHAGEHGYFNLAVRNYQLYPLSFLAALSGSLFILLLSRSLESVPVLRSLLALVGRHTLPLYWVHCLDWLFPAYWHLSDSTALNALARLGFDLTFAALISGLGYVLWKPLCRQISRVLYSASGTASSARARADTLHPGS